MGDTVAHAANAQEEEEESHDSRPTAKKRGGRRSNRRSRQGGETAKTSNKEALSKDDNSPSPPVPPPLDNGAVGTEAPLNDNHAPPHHRNGSVISNGSSSSSAQSDPDLDPVTATADNNASTAENNASTAENNASTAENNASSSENAEKSSITDNNTSITENTTSITDNNASTEVTMSVENDASTDNIASMMTEDDAASNENLASLENDATAGENGTSVDGGDDADDGDDDGGEEDDGDTDDDDDGDDGVDGDSTENDGSCDNITSISENDASPMNDVSIEQALSTENESAPQTGSPENEKNGAAPDQSDSSQNNPNDGCIDTQSAGEQDANTTPGKERSLGSENDKANIPDTRTTHNGVAAAAGTSQDKTSAGVPAPVAGSTKDQKTAAPGNKTSTPRSSVDLGIPPSASTMEQEVEFLREEVRSKTSTVQRLQTSLYDQQVRTNVAMVTLRTQIRKKEVEMRQVRAQHEQRMQAMLQHLLYLEGQMRQEQRHVLAALHDKDDVIRRQKSAIEDLASKNAKLLAALKEVHGYSGGNGISSTSSSPSTTTSPSPVGGVEKGGNGMVVVSPQVVLRNKDKGQKVRFSSMKDKLRRHKSSLELHRPASLETLVEGTLRYSSQENLSDVVMRHSSPAKAGGGGGGDGEEPRKTRQQERKERCKSLVDYPFRLNDLPEAPSEVEKGRAEPASPLHDPLHLSPNGGRNSLYSDEDDLFNGQGLGAGGKQYGELAKATSLPQSLSSVSAMDTVQAGVRERPHSLSGVDLSVAMDKMSMMPMEKVSMNPSPTSLAPPGGSESNPFKSIKNAFKRRNSKQRSKKQRPVSITGTQGNQEEALKEHFKKYDLS